MDLKLEPSWKNLLKDEFTQPYFQKLNHFLTNEYNINSASNFPRKDEIFKALNACPIENVKVVILGQDPYPTKGHANGLCFSVNQSVKPFPKSLMNIFKEIESDLGKPLPENGDLNRWAEQGVLLLNTVLTVHEGQPDSHAGLGWELFTDSVIRQLNAHKKGIVYLLWGAKAQQKGVFVSDADNLVLKTAHPSPLSSYRGFFGCKHFSKTNAYLVSKGTDPIEW